MPGANGRMSAALALLACSGAVAQDPGDNGVALIELLSATGFECEFSVAAEPGPESAEAGAVVSIAYRSIALSAGTAAGGDPEIGGDVRIIPSNLGLHFYQFDGSGELSLVTVVAARDETGRHPAVLSRHHAGDGRLETSQLTGHCAAPATA